MVLVRLSCFNLPDSDKHPGGVAVGVSVGVGVELGVEVEIGGGFVAVDVG